MARSAAAWAVVAHGGICVRSIAPTRREAIIAWLRAEEGLIVPPTTSDYVLEESFALLAKAKRAEAVPVTISAPMLRSIGGVEG